MTDNHVVARIDRDYLFQPDDINPSRVGEEWLASDFQGSGITITLGDKVRFRCLDDDAEVYYGGWLLNDDECIIQAAVLEWTMRDAGCTIIEVKLNDKWVREIG